MDACVYVGEVVQNEYIIDPQQLKKLKVDTCILSSDRMDTGFGGVDGAMKLGIEIQYFPYTKGVSSTLIRNKIGEE